MGTVVKDFLVTLVSLGIIETFITLFYFTKISKFKIKIIDFILYLIFITIMYYIPPVIRQFFIFLGTLIYLNYRTKIKIYLCIKFLFAFYSVLLITEVIFSIFYEIFLNLDFTNMNGFKLFIFLLPCKILQILLIKNGGKYLWGLFGLVKTQKKK